MTIQSFANAKIPLHFGGADLRTTPGDDNMKAYFIAPLGDESAGRWFVARASWLALDAAKAAGFDEVTGFEVLRSLDEGSARELGLAMLSVARDLAVAHSYEAAA